MLMWVLKMVFRVLRNPVVLAFISGVCVGLVAPTVWGLVQHRVFLFGVFVLSLIVAFSFFYAFVQEIWGRSAKDPEEDKQKNSRKKQWNILRILLFFVLFMISGYVVWLLFSCLVWNDPRNRFCNWFSEENYTYLSEETERDAGSIASDRTPTVIGEGGITPQAGADYLLLPENFDHVRTGVGGDKEHAEAGSDDSVRSEASDRAPTAVEEENTQQVQLDDPVRSEASEGALTAVEEEENTQQARSDYLARAKRFEEEIDPALEAISLAQWDPELAQEIQEDRDRALREFTSGLYATAVDLLEAAEASARKALEIGETRFREHLDQASDALEASDPALAKRHINQALRIKPEDAEGQALRGRIDVLPEVLQAIKDADRARTEKDFRAELSALERVLGLDSLRVEMVDRYRQLVRQKFGEIIMEGLDAVDEQALPVARRALQRARELAPGRDEVEVLEVAVERLQREVDSRNFLAEANAQAIGDDWHQARAMFRKVLAIDPSNADALNGADVAGRIIDTDEQIVIYLQRPDRLSSDNVAEAARGVLDNAKDALDDARLSQLGSARQLAKHVEELEIALGQAHTEIEVLVRSDNMTEITVRRVGSVGRIIEKVIKLRPGTYVFEGKREGYRSKLVELSIVAGRTAPVEVIVVCDEPL